MELTREEIIAKLKLEKSILADGGYERSVPNSVAAVTRPGKLDQEDLGFLQFWLPFNQVSS